mgnify:CR=1 FL=1
MAKSKKALGRGLDALFASSVKDEVISRQKDRDLLPIDEIKTSSFQPRQNMSDEGLKSLAQSIKEHGILQPLIGKKLRKLLSSF